MYFVYFVVAFILPLSCSQPTDSTDEGIVERERIEVSGSITEDTVWETGGGRPETGGKSSDSA